MFKVEATALSTATPEALWPLYADVNRWSSWDEDLRKVTLEGPFAVGSRGVMDIAGQPPIPFTLTEVTPNVSFTDEAKAGPMTVRFVHTLTRLTGGTRITHTATVEGPAAEKLGEKLGVQHAVESLARLSSKATQLSLGGMILYVPDVEKSAAFYERAFGCTVAMRTPGGGFVQLSGSVPLAFCEENFAQQALPTPIRKARRAESPAACEVLFVVADVPAAFERAVKAGGDGVVPPVTKPWGQVVSYVRYLDGALVELCSPW